VTRRFLVRRPTRDQFAAGLNAIDMSIRQFARCSGADIRRVERWLTPHGKPDSEAEHIPQWVAGYLIALANPETRRQIEAWADGEGE
jgi:hypothetical protein